MIKTLEDLSELLHQWYGETQGALSLDEVDNSHWYAPPLVKAWSLFGGLFSDSKKWGKHRGPTPLFCQDELAPVTKVRRYTDRLDFAFENQGNWSFGYKHKSESADPRVFSDWLYTELEYDPGFVQIGTNLSDFLITLCLQETIHFGWDQDLSRTLQNPDPKKLFGECIWEGRYFNAIGFDDQFKSPSHIIHSNSDRTQLVLYTKTATGLFSNKPWAARRSLAQDRYQNPGKIW